jgi:hypothetical protein
MGEGFKCLSDLLSELWHQSQGEQSDLCGRIDCVLVYSQRCILLGPMAEKEGVNRFTFKRVLIGGIAIVFCGFGYRFCGYLKDK